MNLKRAIIFGIFLWIISLTVISILSFLPFLQEKQIWQNIIFYILLIPIIFLLAKWYFKVDPPTIKKGLYLGLIALMVATILDLTITAPFFIKSYSVFYTNWSLYVGYTEIVLLTTLAGGEFDATFTKKAI